MGSLSGAAVLLSTLALCGCSSSFSLFLEAQFPDGAQSFLVALEQEGRQLVEVQSASAGFASLTLPDSISEDTAARLTLVALSQNLEEIGAVEPGALAPATGRTRALSSLAPLQVDVTEIFIEETSAVLTRGELSAWLADFPIAKVPKCPVVEPGFFIDTGMGVEALIDAVSVGPELAVGLSPDRLTLLRPEGASDAVVLPSGETGTGLGRSREGVLWVVTSSRAAVFDVETSSLTRSIGLPIASTFRGVFDDESAARLYLISTEIEVWELEHATGIWTRRYAVPDRLVRRTHAPRMPARIVPHSTPGRFFLGMEEVAGILDYSREDPRMFIGERTGSGFSIVGVPGTGEVLAAEYFTGDLYRFDGSDWKAEEPGPSQIAHLAALDPQRFMFITNRAVTGVVDLDNPRSCPEVPLVNWDSGRSIVRTGNDFWVGVKSNLNRRGWGHLRVRFDPL